MEPRALQQNGITHAKILEWESALLMKTGSLSAHNIIEALDCLSFLMRNAAQYIYIPSSFMQGTEAMST